MHLFWEHLTPPEKDVWKTLSKVLIMYFKLQSPMIMIDHLTALSEITDVSAACNSFLSAMRDHYPQMLANKLKPHMLLHLPENITDFGATACFSTERY